ncbi:MAG: hypothetical protein ABR585_02245 [Gemmatimonadaceae bacterium]
MPAIEEFLLPAQLPEEVGSQTLVPAGFDYPGEPVEEDRLPPLEHFLDELPEVGSFAPTDERPIEQSGLEGRPYELPNVYGAAADQRSWGQPDSDPGWVETDWQRYDWSGAAALGEGNSSEALESWSETDWESKPSPARDVRESTAEAIANALDHIANRIRHGELAVQPADLITDPAAIAATLAALLGVRR